MFIATLLAQIPAALGAAVPVAATVETAPVHSSGDAADDSAVWIHPTDPSLSTVIGTDKTTTGGLNVYDLSGRELYFYPAGRLNNVDVRYNFPLGEERVSIVGATNRVERRIDFWKVNPGDRSLTPVGSVPTSAAIVTPRGFALYHSPVTGTYHAFVSDSGNTDQYELSGASGSVTGTLVRQFRLSNPTEGLVADDELGRVYVAEENIGGVWRYGAEPGDGTTGVRIDSTTENGGHIVQDVKGITIYYGNGGAGYLLAASQGGNSFHVYNRGDNAWVGEFRIVAGNGIDEVTGQDGIDVTNFGLGSTFPNGFFITQDTSNDGGNQNHKLVPWQTIANAMNPPLTIDNTWDPRRIGDPGGGGDTTPPETTITSGPSGTVPTITAEFTFSASEVGSTFECALDGALFAACTSPAAYGGLAEGPHTFQVRATDVAGNTDPTPAARTWTIDTSAPVTSIFAPTADASVEAGFPNTNFGTATSLKVDGSPQEETYLRFAVEGLTGALQTATLRVFAFSGTVDGPATFTAASAWSETGVTWNSRPARTSAAIADAAAIAGNTWVEYDVTAAVSGNGTYTFDLGPTSSDGVDFYAREATGNRPQLVIVTSGGGSGDTTPPETVITSGPTGTVASTTAEFAFSASEAGSTFECALDDAVYSACTSPAGYAGLGDGTHTFLVRATDVAQNTDPTPAARTWVVDTAPPTVTGTVPVDGAADVAVGVTVQAVFSEAMNPATLTGETFVLVASGQATPLPATVTYDSATRQATLDPATDLAPATSYTARVTTNARDTAGNQIAADTIWSFTTTATPAPRAIRRESVATVVNGSPTASVTIAKPSGTAFGEVLVACVALNGGGVAGGGVPAGWSPIAAVTSISSPRVFGYYKATGASEPSQYTWTLTSSVKNGAGIARYSGVSTQTPVDATVTTAAGASATSATIPGVTTVTPNAMLVGCMGINSSASNVTITSPVGMAEAWDIGGKRHELADGVHAGPGPTGSKTWRFSSARAWAGWLVALRPG